MYFISESDIRSNSSDSTTIMFGSFIADGSFFGMSLSSVYSSSAGNIRSRQ